ncbi:uncharacterized protein B0H18DRAFT_1115985 [Fomitopsis serialis]|uniref:uncharacterized protein n=1 Tax=Fomitopsis serialis TaxID=139415 RepID=UPI00200824D7|nr:uncharacterized protein B0H18DRAFT_1115985 [Neoantrodia serialis]KAH9932319.1 hypothetical protein B0H18DRAFT_1115985 [Neoantrodia serialis]
MQAPHWIPATQRLLAISEVLIQVAEDADDKFTVASLARTCRDFCSPALDVLWRSQVGLANIVKCMPPDLWEIREDGGRSSHPMLMFMFRRPMCASDWDRFNVYAPRIRELTLYLCDRGNTRLPGNVYATLNMHAPSLPLFPSLRNWRCYDIPHATVVPDHWLFLGSSLAELVLEWDVLDERAAFLMACLPFICPKLRTLRIRVRRGFASYLIWLQPTPFSSLKELRTFEIRSMVDIPVDTLMAELQSLPWLSDLTLNRYPGPLWASPAATIEAPPSFRALTSLQLAGDPGNSCMSVLATSYFPALEELYIKAAAFGPLDHIFRTIHDHCSHTSLHTLHVTDGVKLREDTPDFEPLAHPAHFRYLHAFRGLEEVWIETLHGILLTDDDLRDMALAWPRLRALRLLPSENLLPGPPTFEPAGTLAGLAHFALHCPDLGSLAIAIDTSEAHKMDILSAFPALLERVSALTHLLLGQCEPMGKPEAIATSLAIIFPNLEEVLGSYPDPFLSDVWEEVDRLYPKCLREHNARRQQLKDMFGASRAAQ